MYAKCKFAIPARAETFDFVAQRSRENKGSFTLDTWSTPMTEFGVLDGLNLSVRGQAVWRRPGGDLLYADLELSEIEYNGPIEAF